MHPTIPLKKLGEDEDEDGLTPDASEEKLQSRIPYYTW